MVKIYSKIERNYEVDPNKMWRMEDNLQNETQKHLIEQDNIVYLINENEKTVSVYGCNSNENEINIPRSIKHQSNEYDVISILSYSIINQNVQFIEFAKDSNLQTIEYSALVGSSIESITIPSKVINLKKGWCRNAFCLNKVNISPSNPRYACLGEQMIIGKSSIESADYDCLCFCVRNIKKVTIPTFIKIIESCAFFECKNRPIVEIPANSKLEEIEKEAFKSSSIERFTIPSQLRVIGERAFSKCKKLRTVEIPENSKLEKIEKEAFKSSSIERFTIPSQLRVIGEHSFADCQNLRYVNILSNSRLENIEKGVFSSSGIKCLAIPPSVETIGQNSFFVCQNLELIEIDENSKIKRINQKMFQYCKRLKLMIPAKLSHCIKIENLVTSYLNILEPEDYSIFNY